MKYKKRMIIILQMISYWDSYSSSRPDSFILLWWFCNNPKWSLAFWKFWWSCPIIRKASRMKSGLKSNELKLYLRHLLVKFSCHHFFSLLLFLLITIEVNAKYGRKVRKLRMWLWKHCESKASKDCSTWTYFLIMGKMSSFRFQRFRV